MWARGIDLSQIVGIDVGADAVRIEFADGTRRFVGEADGAFEVLEAWRLERRLAEKENANE